MAAACFYCFFKLSSLTDISVVLSVDSVLVVVDLVLDFVSEVVDKVDEVVVDDELLTKLLVLVSVLVEGEAAVSANT